MCISYTKKEKANGPKQENEGLNYFDAKHIFFKQCSFLRVTYILLPLPLLVWHMQNSDL